MLNKLSLLKSPTSQIVLLTTAILLGSLAVTAPQAEAQVTAKTLIGDAVSGDPEKYTDVAEAIKRFANRDYLAARTLLERAKQQHPRLPPVDLTLAKMYVLSGQSAAARAALERTVRDSPGDPETYLITADQLYSQGRLIEAEALYDKAIRLVDGFSENEKRKRNFVIRARAGRAAVSAIRQDWDTAIEDLRAWVEADPDQANAHNRLGRALFMNNNAKEGLQHLEKAQKLNEELPNPYVTAATIYEQQGERELAKKTFRSAVEKDKSTRTLVAYAQWLIQTDSIDRAEKVLASARKSDPTEVNVQVLSGVAARMAGKRGPAEDYFATALSLSPGNRSVINQLALLLSEQGTVDPDKGQRALQFAQMNKKLYPDDTESNITLAWIFYQLQKNNEANQALQAGLQLGNLNPDSRYLVSKMLVDRGRKDDAKKLLKEALKADYAGIFVSKREAEELLKSIE